MKLTPKIDDNIKCFLNNQKSIYNLINTFGSPLNIVFPKNIKNNIESFKKMFDKYNVKGYIYYAHKCNKSSAIVKEVLNNNINIDVSSLGELRHALSMGFTSSKIEATGPKNDEFIILGLRHNIIFNVDNLEEINTIIKYYKKINKKEKIKVLIRLNDFTSEEDRFINKQSRFGIPKKESTKIIKYMLDNSGIITLLGFSFHLDTVNIKEKTIAIENIIDLFELSYDAGLNPYIINIGGGFKLNYLDSLDEWNNSISELKEDILSSNPNLTWNNTSFGLRTENGKLRGNLNIYNYYEDRVKEKLLEDILLTRLSKFQNRNIGEILSENMIELMIEPGRSLLDQIGINIARVVYTKKSSKGDFLVGIDMNKSNLLIGDQEMFIDPILISKDNGEKENIGCYILGNLCLESDLIFKHKIFFDKKPKKNDLLVFINTAGYFMDFDESNTIMQKVANKLIAIPYKNEFKYFLDENYEPLNIEED